MEDTIATKIESFFGQGSRAIYDQGQIIVAADQEPKGVMWLNSGIVEQYSLNRDGVKASVNVFKPPAFFPMSWAINRTPNQYYYVAHTSVELKLCSADETVAFIKNNPDVLYDLLGRVYRGTDGLLQRLALAGTRGAGERLLFELVTECYRFGRQMDDSTWRISISQVSLAARSGLARETVSRELHKLVEVGWLELSKRDLIIKDLKVLERALREQSE